MCIRDSASGALVGLFRRHHRTHRANTAPNSLTRLDKVEFEAVFGLRVGATNYEVRMDYGVPPDD
eukprot:13008125-Alexandrium_andersonii.AAC.1